VNIVNLFVKNNGVRYINLPTNGLNRGGFASGAGMPGTEPRLELHINIALDGLRIRMMPCAEFPEILTGDPVGAQSAESEIPVWKRLEVHFNTVSHATSG